MKKLPLLFLLILFAACTEDETSANEPPRLEHFRVDGELVLSTLEVDKDYMFSFTATDEKNLKSYGLELMDLDGNFVSLLREREERGRRINIRDTFRIDGSQAVDEYFLRLSVKDYEGGSASLSSQFKLIR